LRGRSLSASYPVRLFNGGIAQLVERLVRNEKARGSNPLTSISRDISSYLSVGYIRAVSVDLRGAGNNYPRMLVTGPSFSTQIRAYILKLSSRARGTVSGQRRAAGLAFLLSVYLARPWCRWKNLVLDDPAQHIDDFRAMHVVEVLAAIRQSGQQIICSVEDSSLADLLCRRLPSTPPDLGMRYDLERDVSSSAIVEKQTEIMPMAIAVLRHRDETSVVG
jgi:hypothetical protein